MTTTTIVTPDQDAVVSEIEIAAPAARVFQALTDADQLRRWFSDASCPVHRWEMDARLGGRYRYTTEKGTAIVNNVSEFECHGEILEYDPPRGSSSTPGSATGTTTSPPHRGSLGTHAHENRYARESHPQRPGSPCPAARKDYSGGWTGVLEMLKKFVCGLGTRGRGSKENVAPKPS
jgi:uncharacterized protein YndB with AHSA1/START domain